MRFQISLPIFAKPQAVSTACKFAERRHATPTMSDQAEGPSKRSKAPSEQTFEQKSTQTTHQELPELAPECVGVLHEAKQ
jgi:hypothetical protein